MRVGFSAAPRIAGLQPAATEGRLHGHDFTATFLFETATLTYPGVVVDDAMRAEILDRVTDRAAPPRPRPPARSARHLRSRRRPPRRLVRALRPPPGRARLVSVTVATDAGGHGEIHLPTGGPR
ncbi:MAG: hypothetical protein ACRDRK_03915 [Pseudonocardia sp.]